ncbi:MAG: hypothetical protein ACOCVR_00275, partial [Myxococcota bacterium]
MRSTFKLFLGFMAVSGLLLTACGGDDDTAECEPRTCESAGLECGVHDDNCGVTIDCGSCSGTDQCVDGVCQACQPETCESLGAECDSHPDGCGDMVDCGNCDDGYSCQAGTCVEDECVPETCESLGFECDTHDDGCGGTVECGDCDDGYSCESGVCVEDACVPDTCQELGVECGSHDDGCGGTVNCGDCAGSQDECQEGVCVCVPPTCEELGRECGTWNDGCGDTITCGPCPEGTTCRDFDGMCIESCVPQTCEAAGAECGFINDGCGNVVDCGQCSDGLICGAETPNQCGEGACEPETCESLGYQCGSHTDGCGDFITCGPCAEGESCDASYQCVDAGLDDGEPCTQDDECGGDFCITEADSGFRDGYCSGDCTEDDECTSGICSSYDVCAAECTQDSDCRGAGYICMQDEDGQSICWPGANGPGEVGDPCENYWDCGGREFGACADSWPNGYCTIACDAEEGTTCPTGTTCWDDLMCLVDCVDFDECRLDDGYTCAPVDGNDACVPGCETDTDCDPHYCDPTHNICVECTEDGHCATGETCVDGVCETGSTGTCDVNGFTAASESVEFDADNDLMVYEADNGSTEPIDYLAIEWWVGYDFSTLAPGTYTLGTGSNDNYATCSTCVLIMDDCTDGSGCAKFFFASAGTVEITEIGADGTPFSAVLNDVELAEVTIDSETWESTPVANGETWCLDGHQIDATMVGNPPTSAGCTENADCSDPTPFCEQTDGICVECLEDGDCSGTDECLNNECTPVG